MDVIFDIFNDYPKTRKLVRFETLKYEENFGSLFSTIVKKINELDTLHKMSQKYTFESQNPTAKFEFGLKDSRQRDRLAWPEG
jgi:lantibiotic modifying enzyme